MFVFKYIDNIDTIYILMKTQMIKKKDQSYQSAYYSASYTTSSPAHPQVSTVSLMYVLISFAQLRGGAVVVVSILKMGKIYKIIFKFIQYFMDGK